MMYKFKIEITRKQLLNALLSAPKEEVQNLMVEFFRRKNIALTSQNLTQTISSCIKNKISRSARQKSHPKS